MRQLLTFFLLLSISFVSCSRNEIELTFKISRPEIVDDYTDSQPSNSTDFNCFALNIIGEGIGNGPTNQSGSIAEILNGDFCSYPGASSTLVPANAAGATLKVRVAPGKNRLIQVIGIKSSVGCPADLNFSKILAETQNSIAPTNSNFQGLYEIGRKIIPNLTQAQSLDILTNFSTSSDSVALKNLRVCKIQEPFLKFKNEELATGGFPSGATLNNFGSSTGKGILPSITTVNANFDNSPSAGLHTSDANARFAATLSAGTSISTLTGFLVAKWTSVASSGMFFCFTNLDCFTSANTSKRGFSIEVANSATPRVGFNIYNSSNANSPAFVTMDTNYHVYSFRWSAAENIVKMRSDLNAEASGTLQSTNILDITKPATPTVQLGNDGANNEFYIKEIRVYDQALTADQRLTITQELADKYGVTL